MVIPTSTPFTLPNTASFYIFSQTIFRQEPSHRSLADRIYYLNKSLNAIDLFYEVEMSDIFHLDHPVGTVLGRATYGDHFSCGQNCTVGNNRGIYPTMGFNVKLLSGSMLIGNCQVGDNVILAANTYVKDCDIQDCDIPSYSIVFGNTPNLTIKPKDPEYFSPPN